MNKWRMKHADWSGKAVKKAPTTFGELSDDDEVSDAAEDVYSEATKHREGVIAKDKAAKARRKGARRG